MNKQKRSDASSDDLSRQSLRFGWWTLLAFLSLGIALEALHGFKVSWYLDVGVEMRRLMFTLAHAHGTLLALINIAVGLTARSIDGFPLERSTVRCLQGAGLLLPLGFLLGGITIHGGDPGVGIFLVPVGGFLLLYGVARVALGFTRKAG